MNRYHIKIGFKIEDIDRLKDFTNQLHSMEYRYTLHSIENIKYRAVDLEGVLRYIKGARLDFKDIFEYYTDGTDKIIKVCYRLRNYNLTDIILVLNDKKEIITTYLNDKTDEHFTLKKDLYNTP